MQPINFIVKTIYLSLFSVYMVFAQSSEIEFKSWPSEILFDRLVLLRNCQVDVETKLAQVCDLNTQISNGGPSALNDPVALTELLETAFEEVDFRKEFIDWFLRSDQLARGNVGDLVRLYRRYAQSDILSGHFDDSAPEEFRVDEISRIIAMDRLDQYDYAYGKEVGRKVLKQFDAIHRQTFFENKTHNIDINIDFIEPIKAIVTHLQLKEKFKWLFNNKLYFGYKSSFKHKRKVFIRFLGYYAKVSVDIELLRRKIYWWGYGEWEKVGITSKVIQEPVAIVGTDAKEI